ncbi:DinB family protein [Spirosoma validum]|uniref:DinB family protein n=1 Tax=Spirosoma validum TaxID=2771355 RepID=A0A927B705_9BACT|nr:DinB family protein [Spirosoma validum]MBD2756889.1 DinB family protein [Spirosoma validum]
MKTEFVSQIWQLSQGPALGPTRKLTPANYRNRLTPETASAGFIALHTAEVMHRFANILFDHPINIPIQTMGGVSDEGSPLNLPAVQQLVEDSFAMISDQIQHLPDAAWAETVTSPFGELPRLQVLMFLIHHNSYHAGQLAQAVKKGRVFGLTVSTL